MNPVRSLKSPFRLSTAALVAVAIVALSGCSSSSSTLAGPTLTPLITPVPASAGPAPALRDLAGTRYFGTAVGLPQLDRDKAYATLVADQFSQLTAENAMKWEVVEPTRGEFNWTGADEIVAFAQAHNQKVRGHTLLWHNQLPGWLTGGTFTKAQLSDILQQHIAAEMGRYAGKIYAWDVVNEVINADGTRRDDLWQTTIGDEYVADAFKWARAADPTAKLYINDYDIEGINAKSDALYDLVKSLKSQGVPIDGVGFQAHFDTSIPFPTDMAENMKRFADLGLEVAITEMDVRVDVPATPAALSEGASYYKQAVQACTGLSACVGMTVWGFTDKYSWVPSVFPGKGAACLYDENLSPKPAYAAVEDALRAAKP
jgi:endo-1,4-beta-xylanase